MSAQLFRATFRNIPRGMLLKPQRSTGLGRDEIAGSATDPTDQPPSSIPRGMP
jgi:hypothetical protein